MKQKQATGGEARETEFAKIGLAVRLTGVPAELIVTIGASNTCCEPTSVSVVR